MSDIYPAKDQREALLELVTSGQRDNRDILLCQMSRLSRSLALFRGTLEGYLSRMSRWAEIFWNFAAQRDPETIEALSRSVPFRSIRCTAKSMADVGSSPGR